MASPFDLDGMFPGASGDFTAQVSTQHALPSRPAVVRIEQHLPTMKVAGWVPVSADLVTDRQVFGRLIDASFDRIFRPWLYPDRNPMPPVIAVPALEHAATAVRWLRTVAAARIRLAWSTLRHGPLEPEDDDEW